MSGRDGPERRGPERPGPDYPPEWDDEPDEHDSPWPDDDGVTFVAARTIADDPDHVRCADPRCRQTYGNTLRELWDHLEQQHDASSDGIPRDPRKVKP